jgi:hypothetical protein
MIKLSRSCKTLRSKVPNLGHLEELSNLNWDQISIENWMRFFYFKSPFRLSLISLCKRHPRCESNGIFKWVLPIAEVRKFYLGCPPEKTCKTREWIWGGRQMFLTYVTRGQTCLHQMAKRWEGEGGIGILMVRMVRDQHTGVPWGARQKGQLLPFSVETEASIECAKWNQRRTGPCWKSQRNGKSGVYVWPEVQSPE